MADVETKCAHAVCECMVPPRGPHRKYCVRYVHARGRTGGAKEAMGCAETTRLSLNSTRRSVRS